MITAWHQESCCVVINGNAERIIFMPPKKLWEAYSNRTVRPSVCPSRFMYSAFPIFFEVGIPNLACGCILGLRRDAYHFRVSVTLTPDRVFRIIVSGAYVLYYLRYESQIRCVNASLDVGVSRSFFWVTGTLTLIWFLESASSLVHIFYIL